MPSFDVWDEAALLSRHLEAPGAELLAVIGAEAWCQKCQRLRPLFERLCTDVMPGHVAWLWLDLEDHADVLSGFVPPDLPLLLRWRAGVCVQAAVLENIAPGRPPGEQVQQRLLTLDANGQAWDPVHRELVTLPPLWSEFTAAV